MPNGKQVAVSRPIAEVAEAQADADTLALYSAIKRASDTPLVNLIYRHLATIPGALAWAWANITERHGYEKLVAASHDLPRHRLCAPLPEAAWRTAGLRSAEMADLARLVEQYNKTNAINLVAVSCLLRSLPEAAQAPQQGTGDNQPAGGPADAGAQDPAGDVERVQRFLNELVTGDPLFAPTMFRNMRQWPASLAMASAILSPLVATGAFGAARSSSVAAGERIAEKLFAGGKTAVAPPDMDTSLAIAASLRLFQTEMIGSMLPVGHALSGALGAHTAR